MTIEEAFSRLIKSWNSLDPGYRNKYKTFKSRYLNISGKQQKRISYWKKIEMLEDAGWLEISLSIPSELQ